MMLQTAASNTILQTLVDEDKRGRVMSLVAMAFFGTVPFGSLLAGVLAARIGAENTILVGGAVVCVAAAVFFRALPNPQTSPPNPPLPRRPLPRASGEDAVGRGGLGSGISAPPSPER